MPRSPQLERVWIVGPGRLGLGLGWCLAEREAAGTISVIGRAPVAPEHPLFADGRAAYATWEALPETAPSLVLITVPDAAIVDVAHALPQPRLASAPVLHTSGVLGSEILAPLRAGGCPIGSIHPLVAVTRSQEGARRLLSAWYAVEGEDEAVRAALAVAEALKGKTFRVEASRKATYHAAAVFASNYVVALLAVAERLMEQAGVAPGDALEALCDLARGAIDAVAADGIVSALTGPVSRGDASTLERHLARLSPEERSLYSGLAMEALALAQRQGLQPEAARRVVDILATATP